MAEQYGAGFIELTNRANLQLRGLSEAEYAALVPELDALGLAGDRPPAKWAGQHHAEPVLG